MINIEELLNQPDQECINTILKLYHKALPDNKEAHAFLEKKGLDSTELINQFNLGISKRQLGLLFPSHRLAAGKAIRRKLSALGLYRNSGHEHFCGSVTVPIYNMDGHIVNVYGHKVGTRLNKGTAIELTLNDNNALWNIQAGINQQELIVCSHVLDGLRCCAEGVENVVSLIDSTCPLDCFSDLYEKGVRRLILMGNINSEPLLALGFECYQSSLDNETSLINLLNSYPNQKPALSLLIKQATWLGSSEPVIPVEPVYTEAIEAAEVTNTTEDNLTSLDGIDDFLCDDDSEAELMALLDSDIEDTELNEIASVEPLPIVKVPEDTPVQEVVEESNQIMITLGDRVYRIRELYTNTAYSRLKVSILVRSNNHFHLDDLNLYQSRSRTVFINQAKAELGQSEEVIKADIGSIIFILEGLLEKQNVQTDVTEKPFLSATEHSGATEYLSDPKLLDNILKDFKTLGVIGHNENLLACYLAATSRLLDDPIGITIQSASASGKTALMNGVLSFIPDSEKMVFSSITSQSLYYMDETALKHKVLAISELEGANSGNSAYTLKLLQSEKEITIATTLKDEKGNLRTVDKKVEGPIQFFATTTQIDVDDELLNRTLVISIGDDTETTELIHKIQRKNQTLAGYQAKAVQKAIVTKHHHCQQALRRLWVINPYAEKLTFLTCKTRTRRDHQKYLNLIQSITFLHQYQRALKTIVIDHQEKEYIETTKEDITIANRIAHHVLGNSLLEDLPPQTKNLLHKIKQLVDEKSKQQQVTQSHIRFTRSEVRIFSAWSISQLKTHCKRLEELEYLLKHSGGRGQRIEYELLWTGEGIEGNQFSMGLINPNTL